MNHAGPGRPGRLETAAGPDGAGMLEPHDTAVRPGEAGGPADGEAGSQATATPAPEPPRAEVPHGRLRTAASRPVVRHLALIVIYLAAGIAATWPRASYLTGHLLPETRDVSGYVWDLWWTAHQIVHLGNPWFTDHMAAPVGIQLGFDTTMPLAGLIMAPVTLISAPAPRSAC